MRTEERLSHGEVVWRESALLPQWKPTHLGSLLDDLHGIALLRYQDADPLSPAISPSAVEVQPVLAKHAVQVQPNARSHVDCVLVSMKIPELPCFENSQSLLLAGELVRVQHAGERPLHLIACEELVDGNAVDTHAAGEALDSHGKQTRHVP